MLNGSSLPSIQWTLCRACVQSLMASSASTLNAPPHILPNLPTNPPFGLKGNAPSQRLLLLTSHPLLPHPIHRPFVLHIHENMSPSLRRRSRSIESSRNTTTFSTNPTFPAPRHVFPHLPRLSALHASIPLLNRSPLLIDRLQTKSNESYKPL